MYLPLNGNKKVPKPKQQRQQESRHKSLRLTIVSTVGTVYPTPVARTANHHLDHVYVDIPFSRNKAASLPSLAISLLMS